MKVIIVSGVAGGASCAARLCRLDEKAEPTTCHNAILYSIDWETGNSVAVSA